MNRRLSDIMQKRAQLLVRIAGQREQIAAVGARWKLPLAVADHGFAVGRYLRSHPVLLTGVVGVVALVAIKRRGMIAVASGALHIWNYYKTAKVFAMRMASNR